MPAPLSDRSLRRLVAELATTSAEDTEHVLDQLEPRHRQSVQALVDELFGGSIRPVLSTTSDSAVAIGRRAGLSAWALARLEDGAGPLPAGVTPGFSVSPVALHALRNCVAELEPLAAAGAAQPNAVGAAWLRRLWMPVPKAAY